MTNLYVYFVVETNPITETDNAYINWLCKNCFSALFGKNGQDGFRIVYDFIHMSSKSAYKNTKTKKDISYCKSINKNAIFVYCIDVDTTSNEDQKLNSEIETYCRINNYYLIGFYPEIEIVLKVEHPEMKKADRVIYFANHNPSIDKFNFKYFKMPFKELTKYSGSTNFILIINNILSKAKETIKSV